MVSVSGSQRAHYIDRLIEHSLNIIIVVRKSFGIFTLYQDPTDSIK